MATRRKRKRLLRALAWLAALACAVVIVLSLTRAPIVGFALRKLAASGDFVLELSDVEAPSWSELVFRGVHFAPKSDRDALRAIDIDRLRVEYSLTKLVSEGLAGLEHIDGSGLRVRVDLTQPGDPDSSGPSALDVISDIAELLPQSRVDRASVELVTPTIGTIRAGDGLLRAFDGGLRLDTPIEAFGGNADATLSLARGKLAARIDARGMGFAGRTIDWARGQISIDSATISVRDLWIADGSSVAQMPYLDVPLPIESGCTFKESLRGAFHVEIDDLPTLLGEALGENVAESFPEHRLVLDGHVHDGFVDLGPGSLSTERGTLALDRGSAPLADSLRELILDPSLDVALSVDVQDASALGEILGPLAGSAPWSGRVEGSVRVRGGPQGPVGFADLFASHFSAGGMSVEWFAAQASIDAERVHVSRLDARVPGASVVARGSYQLDGGAFEDVEITAQLPDVSVFKLDGLTAGRASVEVHARGVWPNVDATSDATLHDVVWQGSDPGFARVHVRAKENGPLEIDAELDTGCAHAAVRGELTRPDAEDAGGAWRARIDALRATSDASTLELVEPCEISASKSAFELARLHLSGSAGDARVDLSIAEGKSHVRAKFSAFDPTPLRTFIHYPLDCSKLDGEIDARLSAHDLTGHIEARCGALVLDPAAPPLDIAVSADYAEERLSITRIDASTRGEPVLSLSGSLPLAPFGHELFPEGDMEWRGSLELRDLSVLPPPLLEKLRARTGTLFADVDLAGTWRAPRGRVVVGGASIVWPYDTGLGPWSFSGAIDLGDDVQLDDLEIAVDGGARTIVAGKLSDLPGILRALAAGERPNAAVELDVQFGAQDLSTFAERSPVRLRRLGGVLEGELSIRGTIAEPSIHGALHLSKGELRTPTTLPPIQGLAADLAFDGARVDVERIEGELGGAPFRVAGTYDFTGDKRGAHLALEGQNLLLYRQADLTLRADAKLSIEGPPEALVIGGELALSDSRFTREIDWLALPTSKARRANVRGIELFSLTDPPLADARFDVAVRSKNPLRIATRRVQGGLRPDLRLSGTGRLPILLGTIQVDPTRVRLPASIIQVRAGHIDFLSSDPFVPRIEISADARLRGYDVTIGVSGEYDRPIVTLASAPPLAREDLLLLVLTGRAPGVTSGSISDLDAASDVVVYLASDTMGSLFGSDALSDESAADLFQLESGQDVTQKGAATMRASLLVRKDLTRKDDALYLTGERDVYDRYNYGLRLVFRFP